MFRLYKFTKLILFSIIMSFSFMLNLQAMEFKHVISVGNKGGGYGQFKQIKDFAFSDDGHLLVTDSSHAFVQVFDKKTGEFIARFGGKGQYSGHLNKPEGISVAPNGDIYVSDNKTGNIKVYNMKRKWKKTFSEYGSQPGQNRKSMFTDIKNGMYYMPDSGNHRISVWDLKGNFKYTWGRKGNGTYELNRPESAKFAPNGHMYVSDLKNHRIRVLMVNNANELEIVKGWGHKGTASGQFNSPAGISFDKYSNVYVSDHGNNRIQIFNKDGRFLTMLGKKGNGMGEFNKPNGLLVDKTTGWVYVADTANHRFQIFKPVS